MFFFFFFFNDTATTEIYTLSLHDALPIYIRKGGIWNKLSKNRKEYYLKLHDEYEEVLKKITRSEEHTSELQSH